MFALFLLKTIKFCGCRIEETRTPDPYVPNVVRYQLRYYPNAMCFYCEHKGTKI